VHRTIIALFFGGATHRYTSGSGIGLSRRPPHWRHHRIWLHERLLSPARDRPRRGA